MEAEVEQPNKRPWASRGEGRRWLAVAAYLVLLGLTFATITDRRLLLFTVSVLLALMGLTLFRPQAEGVPTPWQRPADLAAEAASVAAPGDVAGASQEQDERLAP
ncbi:MAG: hypothetical protein ACRD2H_12955 [Terriglobales bacterium]